MARAILHMARRTARRTLIVGNALLLLSAALPWWYSSSPSLNGLGAEWAIPLLSIIWGVILRHLDMNAPFALVFVAICIALNGATVALLRRPDHPMQEFTRGMLVILALIELFPAFPLAIGFVFATGFSSTSSTVAYPLIGGLVAFVGLCCVTFGAFFFKSAQTLQRAG